jgi:mRNA interferase MazF
MIVSRGDVVLLDFPFSGGGGSKVRPALVIQNDRDNRRLTNVILAMVTSRTDRIGLTPTQLYIDLSTPDGKRSGLLTSSVVNCVNLFTVDQRRILRVLGSLPQPLMVQVNICLKAALELP